VRLGLRVATLLRGIVSIDQAKGIVTLRDNKTGEISKVKVTDSAQLAKLKVGQPAERSIGMPAPLK
jgi:hypothetical protein